MNILGIILNISGLAREGINWYVLHSRDILNILNRVFESSFKVFLYITAVITSIYLIITLYSMIFVRNKKEQRFIKSKAPKVTVQIPTYNELAALNCAKRCLNFDYPKNKYEIIIGDDSNDKDVSRRIDEFVKSNKNKGVKIFVTRRGGNAGYKPGNLNHMLKRSRGDIILIFDSDFLPKRDFLKRIVTPFIYDKEKKIAGVQARWKPINTTQNLVTLTGTPIIQIFHKAVLPFCSSLAKSVCFCGSAEAVRKDTLINLGGWKHGAKTEDIEYSLRVFKEGYSVKYLPKLECKMEVPFILRDLAKQQMRWAYGVVSAFIHHFKGIFFSRVSIGKKLMSLFFITGYLMTSLIFLLTILGSLSFITHAPGRLIISEFLKDLGMNVLLTSGMTLAAILAYLSSDRHIGRMFKMVSGWLTLGWVVMFNVVKGVINALAKKDMEWFMLQKVGNKEKL